MARHAARIAETHPAPGTGPVDAFSSSIGFFEPDSPHPPSGGHPAPPSPTLAVLLLATPCNLSCT